MKTFQKLYDIIVKLRSPEGCPWDREQNPQTLRTYLVEETFECIEAIDENDHTHVKEELGDIFLLVTMLSYIYQEAGKFSLEDVLEGISEKLIRRHPHVFGKLEVKDSAEVLSNWDKIKIEQEGRKPKDSILDGISRAMPPLEHAYKLQKKVAKIGFDWNFIEELFLKIEEEINETEEAILQNQDSVEEELGDMLFSVVNLCRFLNVDPSLALQRTNNKFTKRFKYIEKKMQESNQEMKKENLAIMEKFWDEAKNL